MGDGTFVALVAVDGVAYHFDAPYSYVIPSELNEYAQPGCRVMVPFGNGNRKKHGLILSVKPLDTEDKSKLKSIMNVIDKKPLFDEDMISLVLWLKEKTFCTLFEAAKAMLPAGIGLNYVVSYMANHVSEDTVNKFNDDERRIYDYLIDKYKFIKKRKF